MAVISGAGSGIGAGLARQAGAAGMRVVLADVDESAAQAVSAEIPDSAAMRVDVAQPEELDRLAREVAERFGPVRLLVNNAGIETLGFAWEIPAERWEQTLRVNLHGVIHGVRAFVPGMLASGEECWIANVASIAALGTMPTQSAYMLTKHAVQSFNECLYLEMQAKGAPIHVSSVIPGWVKSAIFDPADDAGESDFATRQRAVMRGAMAAQGMDAGEAARIILEGIAAGDFWVSTQPEMTRELAAARAAFLTALVPPELTDETRAILES
ncbi:MAG: SDR family NAD(P)-dependent oxidoreductase [Novosphingobium sp.]